jgi:hypothetical protein
MNSSSKVSYAEWFEDQLADFLRGCEVRNDVNVGNYYDTIDQWYTFYRQKCPNDFQCIERLIDIRADYTSRVRGILEKSAIGDIKNSWESKVLRYQGSIDNSKFVFERLILHIKQWIESFMKCDISDKNRDSLTAIKAAATSFLLEKYDESSVFAFGNEDQVLQSKQFEMLAETRATEIKALNQIISSLGDDGSQIKYKYEQLQQKLDQSKEENIRLKRDAVDLEMSKELAERKYSELEQQKMEMAAENSQLRSQISVYVSQVEELGSQTRRLQKQMASDKDNFKVLSKQSQEVIDSLGRFHGEELEQIKNSNELEMNGLRIKFRDLELRKEEEAKHVETMAKTFLNKRQKELSETMNRLESEKSALQGEVEILRVRMQEKNDVYQKLRFQTDQVLCKYKSVKTENSFLLQELHAWREKCNDKDLVVAALQARCSNLNYNTFMNVNDLESQRNSLMANNSIDIPLYTDDRKVSSRVKQPTRDHNLSIKTSDNRRASSDLKKGIESSYLDAARENLQLKEQLLSISQKFKSADKHKEHRLGRLNEELSTMHFLIKNFKKRENSKTQCKIDIKDFQSTKKESPSKQTSGQTRLNFAVSMNALKVVNEKSTISISNVTNTRLERKNSRFQL